MTTDDDPEPKHLVIFGVYPEEDLVDVSDGDRDVLTRVTLKQARAAIDKAASEWDAWCDRQASR